MPSSNKVIAMWPQYLPVGATKSEAPAVSEVMRSIAGGNRWLVEHATGASADDGAPRVHRNNQGLWGHDHSGPPYGTAMLHPVATYGCGSSVLPPIYYDGAGNTLTVAEVNFWCRPFTSFVGAPYSKIYWSVWLISGSGTQSVEMTAFVSGRKTTTQTAVETITSIGTSGKAQLSTGYIPCRPGLNQVQIEFKISSGTNDVAIRSLQLFQAVRRSH